MLYLVSFALIFLGFCLGWFTCSIVVAGHDEQMCLECVMAKDAVLEDADA